MGKAKMPSTAAMMVIEPTEAGLVLREVAPGVTNPSSYDLYTLGKDGKPGGDGESADITSWGGPVRQ